MIYTEKCCFDNLKKISQLEFVCKSEYNSGFLSIDDSKKALSLDLPKSTLNLQVRVLTFKNGGSVSESKKMSATRLISSLKGSNCVNCECR